jgi:glycosyltransferase involved in cell wall biosynthesis
VGQTPPPYHGQALMIEKILEGNYEGVKLLHVRMAFSKEIDEIGKLSLFKIFHLFGIITKIYYLRIIKNAKVLYYPPAGPDKVPIIRDIIILITTKWLFKKVIFHFHAGGVSEFKTNSTFFSFLYRKAYYNADCAILLSELNPTDGKDLRAKKEVVIPYGIEDNFSQITATKIKGPTAKILFVGVLKESKGVLILLEACKLLKEKNLNFTAELMGKFESKEFELKVNALIDAYNIGDKVKFLGVLSGKNKFDTFFKADIFCFPTFYESETFGVVLLEAMQFSLPIVASNWRGIPSIIKEGEAGFLTTPKNAEQVAVALVKLINDPALREKMGKQGRASYLQRFTLNVFHKTMGDLFRTC